MPTNWYLPEHGEPWEVPQRDPVEAAEAHVRRRWRWYRLAVWLGWRRRYGAGPGGAGW
jgi:hypothetical protein